MSRHGLPLAILLAVCIAGCQSWRSDQNYSQTIGGLEQPDALINPSRVVAARYPNAGSNSKGKVQTADHKPARDGSGIQLANNEDAFDAAAKSTTELLERAGKALVAATEASGAERESLLDEAKSRYLNVLLTEPKNVEAHHRLGVVCDLREEYIEAEKHYRTALDVTPHDPDLLSDIGYSYQLQDRPEVAEKFYRRVLHIDPNHASATSNLGRMYAESGDYDAAKMLFVQGFGEAQATQMLAYFFPQGRPQEYQMTNEMPVVRSLEEPLPTITAAPAVESDQGEAIHQPEELVVVDDPIAATEDVIGVDDIPMEDPTPLESSNIADELSAEVDSLLAKDPIELPPVEPSLVDNGISFDEPNRQFEDPNVGEAMPRAYVEPPAPPRPQLQASTPVDPGTFAAAPGRDNPNDLRDGVPHYPSATSGLVPWRQLRVAETYGVSVKEQPKPPVTAATPKSAAAVPGQQHLQTYPGSAPRTAPQDVTRPPIELPQARTEAMQATRPVPPPTETRPVAKPQPRVPNGQLQKYPYGGVVNPPPGTPTASPQVKQLQRATPLSSAESGIIAPRPNIKPAESGIQKWPGLRESSASPNAYPGGATATTSKPRDYAPLTRPVYEPVSKSKPAVPIRQASQPRVLSQPAVQSEPSGLWPMIRPGKPDGQ